MSAEREAELHALVLALAERVFVQSNILSRAAEARMLYKSVTTVFGSGLFVARVPSLFMVFAERQFFYASRRVVGVFADEIDAVVLKSLLEDHAERYRKASLGSIWSRFDLPHSDLPDYRGEDVFWIDEVPACKGKFETRAKYRRLHGL